VPAIVLRMSIKEILNGPVTSEQLVQFMSKKYGKLDRQRFLGRLFELLSWGMQQEVDRQDYDDRLLASFAFGGSGDTWIGVLKSFYPDCFEFYICSNKITDCIVGRKLVLRTALGIRNGKLRKIVNDFLYIEGGTEIPREKILWEYILKNGWNVGFLVNFVIQLTSSLLTYNRTGNFDYWLPLAIFVVWFITFIIMVMHFRTKVVYIAQ
jgi:hypothetical protein